jgi:hypothetical protein
MTTSLRGAAGPVLALVLAGVLAGCGGGFSSGPSSPPDETIRSYAALGDTFTAAPDIGETAGDDGCERSDSNYPALLAKKLKVAKVSDVSCVGATTASFTTQVKPAKTKEAVAAQLEAVNGDTDLVTIGMGLLDRDLLTHMFQVCTAVPCKETVTPQTILADVNAMSSSLTAGVRAIQDKAPNAYIVLVGYPKLVPDAGTCDALPDLEQLGLDASNLILDAINREIQSSARETGVGYVDVARLSTGHELCSGSSWIEDRKDKQGKATTDYRPAEAEQRAVAEAVATLVKNQ